MQRMIGYNNFIDERMGLVEAIYQNYEVLIEDFKEKTIRHTSMNFKEAWQSKSGLISRVRMKISSTITT